MVVKDKNISYLQLSSQVSKMERLFHCNISPVRYFNHTIHLHNCQERWVVLKVDLHGALLKSINIIIWTISDCVFRMAGWFQLAVWLHSRRRQSHGSGLFLGLVQREDIVVSSEQDLLLFWLTNFCWERFHCVSENFFNLHVNRLSTAELEGKVYTKNFEVPRKNWLIFVIQVGYKYIKVSNF